MTIGVLKEGGSENRVALLPENISKLVKKNLTILLTNLHIILNNRIFLYQRNRLLGKFYFLPKTFAIYSLFLRADISSKCVQFLKLIANLPKKGRISNLPVSRKVS